MLAALHYTSLQTAIILLSLFFRRENLLTVLFSAPLYIGIIKLVHIGLLLLAAVQIQPEELLSTTKTPNYLHQTEISALASSSSNPAYCSPPIQTTNHQLISIRSASNNMNILVVKMEVILIDKTGLQHASSKGWTNQNPAFYLSVNWMEPIYIMTSSGKKNISITSTLMPENLLSNNFPWAEQQHLQWNHSQPWQSYLTQSDCFLLHLDSYLCVALNMRGDSH